MWLVSQIGSLGCDLPGCLVIRCNLSPPGNCFMKNTDTATCSDGRGGHKKNMLDSMGIGSTVVSGKPECFCLYPRQNSDTLQWFHTFDSAHCRRRCRRRCYTHPDILRQPCTRSPVQIRASFHYCCFHLQSTMQSSMFQKGRTTQSSKLSTPHSSIFSEVNNILLRQDKRGDKIRS